MHRTDQQIKTHIVNRLSWDTRADAANVPVSVDHGVDGHHKQLRKKTKQWLRKTEVTARQTSVAEARKLIEALLIRQVELDRENQKLCNAQSTPSHATWFRTTFERAGIGMAIVDRRGRIIESNAAFQTMVGYSHSELARMNFRNVTPPEDMQANINLWQELFESKRETYQLEKRFIHKDGSLIWGHLTVSLVRDAVGSYRFGIGMVKDITDRKNAEKQLSNYQERLKSLTSKLILAEEHLKKSLAIQLHDTISQSLFVLCMRLAVLSKSTEDSHLKTDLRDLYKQTGSIMDEAKHITGELSCPDLALLGLAGAVRKWADKHICQTHGMRVCVQDNGKVKDLDEDVQIVLFRGIRELLMNVVKHARAQQAHVAIQRTNHTVEVRVKDDGIGFENRSRSDTSGFGILSITEALAGLGGRLECRSVPHQGTMVCMVAPYPSN